MAATGRNGVPCSLFAWRRFPTPENREALIAGRSRRGWPGVHQSPFASFALHSPGLSSGGTEFNPRRMLVGALLLHNIREIRLLRTAVRRRSWKCNLGKRARRNGRELDFNSIPRSRHPKPLCHLPNWTSTTPIRCRLTGGQPSFFKSQSPSDSHVCHPCSRQRRLPSKPVLITAADPNGVNLPHLRA